MAIGLILGAVVSGAVAWAIAAAARRKQMRKSALSEIASYLGGHGSATRAFGVRHGVAVTFEFATRGSGSDRESWTEIDVVVPAAYPLAIHVRRHRWLDKRAITRGDMIDLQMGDVAFDEAFLVEAAPEDVARVLLDASARRFLSLYQRVELDTMVVKDRKVLRFAVHGWIEHVPTANVAIDFVAAIGARVRDAYADVDREAPVTMGGSPYRPEPERRSVRDASAARVAEVAALEANRARRAMHQKVVTVAIMIVILILIVWLAMISRS